MFDDLLQAIQTGDQAKLNSILFIDPTLAQARVDGHRTPLHIATDWPGHFPNASQTISTLIAKGADVNARVIGLPHTETPLHWAAWNGRVELTRLLIEQGAPVNTRDASYGSSPIAWACHGSTNTSHGVDADYVAIVGQLLDAGATRAESYNRWNEAPESMACPAVVGALKERGFAG